MFVDPDCVPFRPPPRPLGLLGLQTTSAAGLTPSACSQRAGADAPPFGLRSVSAGMFAQRHGRVCRRCSTVPAHTPSGRTERCAAWGIDVIADDRKPGGLCPNFNATPKFWLLRRLTLRRAGKNAVAEPATSPLFGGLCRGPVTREGASFDSMAGVGHEGRPERQHRTSASQRATIFVRIRASPAPGRTQSPRRKESQFA